MRTCLAPCGVDSLAGGILGAAAQLAAGSVTVGARAATIAQHVCQKSKPIVFISMRGESKTGAKRWALGAAPLGQHRRESLLHHVAMLVAAEFEPLDGIRHLRVDVARRA